MAKVFDFIHATKEVLAGRGIKLPLPGQSTTTPETRMEKGLAVRQQIIGRELVAKLYASSLADQLHIQRYVAEDLASVPPRALQKLGAQAILQGVPIGSASRSFRNSVEARIRS